MHELGYCEGVLDAVERRAAGRPVARLGVRAGAFHRLEPGAFAQSFQLVAAGGVADGVTPELVVVPATARCPSCAAHFWVSEPAAACPSCGSVEVDVSGGDELLLEWIEYADPGGGATREAGIGADTRSHGHDHTGHTSNSEGGARHVSRDSR